MQLSGCLPLWCGFWSCPVMVLFAGKMLDFGGFLPRRVCKPGGNPGRTSGHCYVTVLTVWALVHGKRAVAQLAVKLRHTSQTTVALPSAGQQSALHVTGRPCCPLCITARVDKAERQPTGKHAAKSTRAVDECQGAEHQAGLRAAPWKKNSPPAATYLTQQKPSQNVRATAGGGWAAGAGTAVGSVQRVACAACPLPLLQCRS